MDERHSAVLRDRAAARPASLRTSLHRYLFYGWLFRDAERGTALEQASALRHNRAQSRWLPVYLGRWSVGLALLLALEILLERTFGTGVLSAALATAIVFAVMYLLVTAVCWAFLRGRRR